MKSKWLFLSLLTLLMGFHKKNQEFCDPVKIPEWLKLSEQVSTYDIKQNYLENACQCAIKNKLWQETLDILKLKSANAISNIKMAEYQNLLVRIDSFLETHKDQLENIDIHIVENNTKWGIYYSSLGFDLKSIDYINSGIRFFEQATNDSIKYGGLFFNYQWIASIHKKLRAYETSIQENQRSLYFLDKYKPLLTDPKKIADSGIYIAIADTYLSLGDTSNSFLYLQKAEYSFKELLEKNPLSQNWDGLRLNIYSGLAKYYQQTQQFDKSLETLQKMQSYLTPNSPFNGKHCIGIGDAYFGNKNYSSALSYYNQAKDFYLSQYGIKNYQTGAANLKISNFYEKQEKWEDALKNYQQAICNVILDFNDSLNYWSNPKKIVPNQIIGRTELLRALDGKTNALSKLYESNNDIAYLQNAQQASDLSIALIDSIKNDLFLDKDRQFQIADHYPIYEKGIAIAEQLYRLTQDEHQIEKIVALAEQSKSLSLLAMFQPALSDASETAALVERERQLKYEIAKREEALINQRKPLNEDSLYLALQAKHHKWLEETKDENPNYLKFKYDTQVLPIKTIQEKLIAPNQAFIEYFWGEKYLFTIAISPEQVNVYQQEIGTLADSIRLLRELVSDASGHSLLDKSIHTQTLSHYLYKRLLQVPLQEIGNQYDKLLIVRDGLLEYLPFELLDISKDSIPGIFSVDDFLLSHYAIAYANSATLLHLQQQHKNRKAKKIFAGFAPSYGDQALAVLRRSGRGQLNGTKPEVTAIAKAIGGDTFLDTLATEKIFKGQASKYKILHLAMHAFANDQQPGFSELLFTEPNPDSSEDGRLRAIELYNLPLNAQMAVLSACVTGYGKLQRGEGMLSLGHAFTYAGVPSIVSSHWYAEDKYTAMIMTDFYKNLKKGMLKDEALAEAKRKFLKNNEPLSHPYYWSVFVASGDMSSISFSTPVSTYLLLIFAVLLLTAFIYRKKLPFLFTNLLKKFQKNFTAAI